MLTRQTLSSRDFDWQQLRQLAGEDSDFEIELLTIFLQDAESSLGKLDRAIALSNSQAIEEAAHSLQGASANVGARALAATANQLEQRARNGNINGATLLLQQLRQQCKAVQMQFLSRHT
ncbi:MAG: Hpt domain-containing protein [Cyanobacteria bacterium J06634_6]